MINAESATIDQQREALRAAYRIILSWPKHTAPKTVVGELGAADLNPARTEQDFSIVSEDSNERNY